MNDRGDDIEPVTAPRTFSRYEEAAGGAAFSQANLAD